MYPRGHSAGLTGRAGTSALKFSSREPRWRGGGCQCQALALDGTFICWVNCVLRLPISIEGMLVPESISNVRNVSVMGKSEGAALWWRIVSMTEDQ